MAANSRGGPTQKKTPKRIFQEIRAKFQQALDLHQRGQIEQAQAIYHEILKVQPAHFDSLHMLGVAATQAGRLESGIKLIGEAINENPSEASAYSNRGNALRELGRLEEALADFDKALLLMPDHAAIHNNRGNVLKDLKRPEEALKSFDTALMLRPGYAEALNNRGNVLLDLKRPEEAVTSFDKALMLKLGYANAASNRGNALRELKRFNEALESCDMALSLKPDHPEAHYNRGGVLLDMKRPEEALAGFEMAIALRPDYADAYNNRGNVLMELKRPQEALASFEKARSLEPAYAGAHYNCGNALMELGRLDEALESYDKAIALKADYAEVHGNCGSVRGSLNQFDNALASHDKTIALRLEDAPPHSNRLFVMNYHPSKSADEIYEEYRRWNDVYAKPLFVSRRFENERSASRRLRIGYVSPDFCRHSVQFFIAPLLMHHDKSAVEVFAYAQVAVEDDVSVRMRSCVDHWVNIAGLSDEELDARILGDGIDILVDLSGHTKDNRLLVFARKPAPVQVSWLGYGYTTGLTSIDYFLGDLYFTPPGSEPLFSERIVRLPVFTVYAPAEGMGEPGELPLHRNGYVTFGSLSRSIRINHRVMDRWAEILRRVPDAKLLINSDNFKAEGGLRQQYQAWFGERGVEAGRLLFGFDTPPWDVMRNMDITLDCFPHNSGTTLFESLYMGIPFVSLASRPSVGRFGDALAHAIGHPEWVAWTEDEYVDKAVALASNPARLEAIRASLRGEMQTSRLMDGFSFARFIEKAYREMWAEWCTGQGDN